MGDSGSFLETFGGVAEGLPAAEAPLFLLVSSPLLSEFLLFFFRLGTPIELNMESMKEELSE